MNDSRPLPYGWISQTDAGTGHTFYVDTKATPPRSIWVHPLDDEQYRREHPDEKKHHDAPSYSAPSTPPVASSSDRAGYKPPAGKPEKRGFFGKLKDATLGTKEEREQEKRQKEERRRQLMELRERRHQELLAQQAAMYQQQQQQQMMYQQQYGQPQYGGGGYGPPQRSGGGFGGGGMALPLIGGLAGGLLLGEAMDGFGGDDGGGGGDFGGGDF
ncbi:hypothetical protein GGX14DRAFT_693588 [Mycena pura]|uniref:WW domain-containing protein n=1 Tax=Mycena pura TaxID=153505 RepID=A0AAD7E3N1_9AGAR|nr:hypothetical protein GGX14DRAFT_693588 [Mycena pura]